MHISKILIKVLICNISALEHLKMTRPLTLFQMFPTTFKPREISSLICVTVHLIWSPANGVISCLPPVVALTYEGNTRRYVNEE